MLVSGIQRITLFCCLVLSVTLFLPKLFLSGGKEKVLLQSDVLGPESPPVLRFRHGASTGEDDPRSTESLCASQKPEIFSQTKIFQKSSLLSRVPPIYGFGIFLYIIYIFYKLTDKDQVPEQCCSFSILIPEHTAQETSEDEVTQLQTSSTQMKGQRERRSSKSLQKSARSTCEERKLQHLRKIQHLLVEGRLLDDVTPEEEAEETPYSAHWEGYPEETFPLYEVPLCRHWYPSIILEESYGDVPTPEELAERMQREEEKDEIYDEEGDKVNDEPGEDEDPKGMMDEGELEKRDESDDNVNDTDEEDYKQEDIGEDQPYLACNYTDNEKTPNSPENKKAKETSGRRRQITFSNHRHVFHYPKGGAVGCRYKEALEDDTNNDDDLDHEDGMEKKQDEYDDLVVMEEDDPLMEAERLGFSTQFACDPEEQNVDLINFLLTYKPEAVIMSEQSGAAEAPRLRMRCKKQKEGKLT
ncbi:hypothetical protein Q7C36_001537 [Tachysurus vachellii]|uniref:Resistance to inhibitors of cholinesterase protein 3 N-terminal domain-containing protein n=1 Tax=Tachysurus vachellii TaxID=175792 RepID=A0AA88NZG1_TACVA|nr:hypothetical protein Q7C36_001537 [Tachysurus vachellii]